MCCLTGTLLRSDSSLEIKLHLVRDNFQRSAASQHFVCAQRFFPIPFFTLFVEFRVPKFDQRKDFVKWDSNLYDRHSVCARRLFPIQFITLFAGVGVTRFDRRQRFIYLESNC